jgi:hypothetical protein
MVHLINYRNNYSSNNTSTRISNYTYDNNYNIVLSTAIILSFLFLLLLSCIYRISTKRTNNGNNIDMVQNEYDDTLPVYTVFDEMSLISPPVYS